MLKFNLNRFLYLLIFTCTTFCSSVIAQQKVTISINSKSNSLVLQTDNQNRLGTVYFGRSLANAAENNLISPQYHFNDSNAGIYNSAYTPAGTFNLVEPAIQVTHADDNQSLDLKYISNTIKKIDANVSLYTIVLRDSVYRDEVDLMYKVYYNENVIEQWSVIKNQEARPIQLEKYASANLYFASKNYYLTHYNGGWGQEMNPEEEQLTHGIKSIDSKLGTRANLFEPSSFMVSFDQPATEDEGQVLLGTLAWSGNFKVDFELDSYKNLRLIAGINPYASAYQLAPAQTFITPALIYTYSENGKGEASRNLHHWARNYRLADGHGDRLTLLNNWESTYFNFDEKKLIDLFKGAHNLGVDLFLLDDGWFGNKYPRNGDAAGLGDWQENRKKLPQGIGYLVKEAAKENIKFGIWLEPEMVNPKSDLYTKHPDWVIKQPQRPEIYFRNQLVLDLSNPQVQDFVYQILDSLFTKNPKLAFIKWDCNSPIYNAYSAYLQKNNLPQSLFYVDYVKGLYSVLSRVRAKYPKVPMMLCSGGGGRVDYGALQYFTEYWPSDNTNPLERIYIQWEYSYFFPAMASCNHVTDWSSVSLKFRTDVAMMGKLGYDIVVDKLSKTDLLFSQNAVSTYRSLKDLIFQGEMYRLVNPRENPMATLAFSSADKKKAVVFSYLTSNRFLLTASQLPVRLKGLSPSSVYQVKEINLYPGAVSSINDKQKYSGDFLMTVGINPDINLTRTSVVLEVKEVGTK